VDWVTWLFTLDFNKEETSDAEPCLSGASDSAFPDPAVVTWEEMLLPLWLETDRSPSLVELFWLEMPELRDEFPLLSDLVDDPVHVELFSCWADVRSVLAEIFPSRSTAELFFPSMIRFLDGSSTPSKKKENTYIWLGIPHTYQMTWYLLK
jgi:hypothetical protein